MARQINLVGLNRPPGQAARAAAAGVGPGRVRAQGRQGAAQEWIPHDPGIAGHKVVSTTGDALQPLSWHQGPTPRQERFVQRVPVQREPVRA